MQRVSADRRKTTGLQWLKGASHKGHDLLTPLSLLRRDPEPCFASKKAQRQLCQDLVFEKRVRHSALIHNYQSR
ncbi:MAG: hypothetical protein AAFO76_16185 [Cyanobacteria bacterium J06607_15]